MSTDTMLTIDDLDKLIDQSLAHTPEEVRRRKLLRELSDYHTPRLMSKLATTCEAVRYLRKWERINAA